MNRGRPGHVARELDRTLDRLRAGLAEKAHRRLAHRGDLGDALVQRGEILVPESLEMCRNLSAALFTASTTSGCAWPVAQTAIPATKSRNRLPSTSQTSVPRPWEITNG